MANVKLGAILQCSMGTSPASLRVNRPSHIANILDNAPLGNIPSFGMCLSMANPIVAAASAAAHGLLTPMPCIPQCVGPWAPGDPMQLVGPPQAPALTRDSILHCTWGGVIQITFPG